MVRPIAPCSPAPAIPTPSQELPRRDAADPRRATRSVALFFDGARDSRARQASEQPGSTDPWSNDKPQRPSGQHDSRRHHASKSKVGPSPAGITTWNRGVGSTGCRRDCHRVRVGERLPPRRNDVVVTSDCLVQSSDPSFHPLREQAARHRSQPHSFRVAQSPRDRPHG